ncbi:MAG: cytidylate kinase-like family protein [Desulfobaccales bacterium]
MAIITISRGSYSRGKEVAEKVAEALGYECISRDILLEASEQFNIPEIKLVRAIHDAPSILERFTYGKERYVAYIKSALMKHVQKDNVVYHGLAGHFFLQDIPHVLKVRIVADLEDRIAEEMKRENISATEARHILKKDDDERRRWSIQVFGVDTWDPMLYDMVLHIKSITVDCAVELILQAVKYPCFTTTPQSQKILDDQTLAARVQSALVEEFPTATVSAKGEELFVDIKGSLTEEQEIIARVRRIANQVAGIEVKMQYLIHP